MNTVVKDGGGVKELVGPARMPRLLKGQKIRTPRVPWDAVGFVVLWAAGTPAVAHSP